MLQKCTLYGHPLRICYSTFCTCDSLPQFQKVRRDHTVTRHGPIFLETELGERVPGAYGQKVDIGLQRSQNPTQALGE
jgi:hypothetical protein